MEDMINKLVAQGIDRSLAESMVASLKPKKAKVVKRPTNGYVSKKVDKEITITSICQCCGTKDVSKVTIKATSTDSPDTQKVSTSVCSACPDFVRQFTHEQLVTMILIGEKSAQELRFASVKFRGQLSQKLTPEKVITFTTLSNMEKEV
jgi:hypothetical protein